MIDSPGIVYTVHYERTDYKKINISIYMNKSVEQIVLSADVFKWEWETEGESILIISIFNENRNFTSVVIQIHTKSSKQKGVLPGAEVESSLHILIALPVGDAISTIYNSL